MPAAMRSGDAAVEDQDDMALIAVVRQGDGSAGCASQAKVRSQMISAEVSHGSTLTFGPESDCHFRGHHQSEEELLVASRRQDHRVDHMDHTIARLDVSDDNSSAFDHRLAIDDLESYRRALQGVNSQAIGHGAGHHFT